MLWAVTAREHIDSVAAGWVGSSVFVSMVKLAASLWVGLWATSMLYCLSTLAVISDTV